MRKKPEWDTQPSLREYIEKQREEVLDELDPKRVTTARKLTEWVGGELRLSEGGYRRRQLLELLQNGVDAAQPVGARITVRVRARHLYVANTGAPMSRDGVDALLSMHNSPKRGQIGKFGLGFKSLLGLSDSIDVISRSVSIRFDRKTSRDAVLARYSSLRGSAIPVMRLAWALSPEEEAREDPLLKKLMETHDTIVKITLRNKEARDLVKEELVELRPEFLLFTGKDITLDCDGRLVSLLQREDNVRVLRDDGKESRWKVFANTISIPATAFDATRDAGSLYGTEDLPIAWAVPLDQKRHESAGQFWSFFPLAERNRIPGILNAPFKTNDDRSNLIDGAYNRALFEQCADLIVANLTTLRTPDDAARHLDFLPRRDDGNDLAKQLGEAVWKRARLALIAPDTDSELRLPASVRTPPTKEPELMNTWRELAPPLARAKFAHVDVLREDGSKRSGRWAALVGTESVGAPGEWLTLVASTEPTRAPKVIDLADALRGSDPKFAAEAQTWRIIPDAQGALHAGRELLLAGDVGEACVSPILTTDVERCAKLLRLGVREKDAAWHKERQNESRRLGNWQEFWERRRVAPEGARITDNGLSIRTRDGNWRRGILCILGKELLEGLPALAAGDPALPILADTAFHSHEELMAAGVNESDDRFITESRETVAMYRDWQSWIHSTFREVHRRGPAPRLIRAVPISLILDLLRHDRYRERITNWLSQHTFESAAFGYDKAPEIFPDPEAWALRSHGSWGGNRFPLASMVHREKTLCDLLGVSQEAIQNVVEGLLKWTGLHDDEHQAAKKELTLRLEPQYLEKLSHDNRLKIYEAAAGVGVVPDVFIVGHRRIHKGNLYVRDEWDTLWETPIDEESVPSLINYEEEPSPPYFDAPSSVFDERVLVVSSDAIEAFLSCGIRRFVEVVQGVAPDEPEHFHEFAADERFPWLAAVLKPGVESIVRVFNGATASVTADTEQKRLIVLDADGATHARDVVLRAAEALGWLSEPFARANALICEGERLRSSVQHAQVSTHAGRLLNLVGRATLAADLLAVRHFLQGVTDLRVAETFLWKHGPGVLRALEETLRQQGYGPPSRWGTARAREFALSLGFPAEFGGSPDARREESIEVDGPAGYKDLHDFQREVRDALRGVLTSEGERAMVCLPTGAGKTRVVVESVVDEVLKDESRARLVLWIAQQDELCEQAVQTFRQLWRARGADETLTISRLWAGNRPGIAEGPHVVVATIQTLLGRFEDPEYRWLQKPTVIVIDEAHHGTAKSYTALLDWIDSRRERRLPVIGLSATPHRGTVVEETQRLAGRFDKRLVPDAERQPSLHDELLKKQVLAHAKHMLLELSKEQQLTPEEIKRLELFHELPQSVSERLADDADRNKTIVGHVLGSDRAGRTLLFAASVNHAIYLASVLTAQGWPAAAIHGGTPTSTRRFFLREFREGRLRVLTNYGVLTTGFDEPKVDTVLVARPTLSPVLYTQMIGRGLRGRANGGTEDCTIVTVVDNWVRYSDGPAWKWFVEFWRAQRSERDDGEPA